MNEETSLQQRILTSFDLLIARLQEQADLTRETTRQLRFFFQDSSTEQPDDEKPRISSLSRQYRSHNSESQVPAPLTESHPESQITVEPEQPGVSNPKDSQELSPLITVSPEKDSKTD
jgi:hypothetical protein